LNFFFFGFFLTTKFINNQVYAQEKSANSNYKPNAPYIDGTHKRKYIKTPIQSQHLNQIHTPTLPHERPHKQNSITYRHKPLQRTTEPIKPLLTSTSHNH